MSSEGRTSARLRGTNPVVPIDTGTCKSTGQYLKPPCVCARVRPVGGYVGGVGRMLKGQEQLQKGKILINEGPKDL